MINLIGRPLLSPHVAALLLSHGIDCMIAGDLNDELEPSVFDPWKQIAPQSMQFEIKSRDFDDLHIPNTPRTKKPYFRQNERW